MRPGQNKRMRGRNNNNNNRKGPNPLTRSYESNGPDVKIRGTAHHIGEKYLQLARDAQSSGDPVMAESYLQHAEHYFRLIASAQQAQQQAAYGYQRPPGEPQEQDEDNDDDFESLPDRFASPSERAAPTQPAPQQPYADRQPYNNNNNGQPYEARQTYQNQPQPQPHYERPQHQGDRQDRAQPERQQQGYDRSQERGGQERGNQQRNYDNRNGRGDRDGYQERGNGQGYQGSNGQQNADRQSDRAPRDYDNRNFRNNRGPREYRGDAPQPREQRQPQVEEPVGASLPAFITGPTRAVPDAPSEQTASETAAPMTQVPGESVEDTNLHMRPRRRRRPKGEFVAGGEEGETRQDASEPAGD